MRTLVVIAFLLANFPVFAHDKGHGHDKPPEPTVTTTVTTSTPPASTSSKRSNKALYAVVGVLGVYAVWSWGKKDSAGEGVKFGVQVKEQP